MSQDPIPLTPDEYEALCWAEPLVLVGDHPECLESWKALADRGLIRHESVHNFPPGCYRINESGLAAMVDYDARNTPFSDAELDLLTQGEGGSLHDVCRLVAELRIARAEVIRLSEFEWMYKGLCK